MCTPHIPPHAHSQTPTPTQHSNTHAYSWDAHGDKRSVTGATWGTGVGEISRLEKCFLFEREAPHQTCCTSAVVDTSTQHQSTVMEGQLGTSAAVWGEGLLTWPAGGLPRQLSLPQPQCTGGGGMWSGNLEQIGMGWGGCLSCRHTLRDTWHMQTYLHILPTAYTEHHISGTTWSGGGLHVACSPSTCKSVKGAATGSSSLCSWDAHVLYIASSSLPQWMGYSIWSCKWVGLTGNTLF